MTDLRTVAQQALEAMESAEVDPHSSDAIHRAITALRAALAEPTPLEDVVTYGSAWSKDGKRIDPMSVYAEPEGGGNLPPPLPGDFDHGIGADRFRVVRGAFWWHVLIGDSPAKRGKFHTQAGAEEMAALLLREFRNGAFVQHKAASPQRKPLTEEEIERLLSKHERDYDMVKFARAIERAHGVGGDE